MFICRMRKTNTPSHLRSSILCNPTSDIPSVFLSVFYVLLPSVSNVRYQNFIAWAFFFFFLYAKVKNR